jgi:hypothetical protein
MSWFFKTETIPAPPPVVDRVEALVEELREIDGQLAALNVQMREFRQKHNLRTDKFSRIVGAQGASVNGFAVIQLEWQGLLKRSDQLFFRRNDVLKEWSALRMERK